MVPFKGANHDWTIDQCIRDLKKWGLHGDLIIRSDQEDALKDLVEEIIAGRAQDGKGANTEARGMEEESPVGESQSNGLIEAGVKTLVGMVRTIKFALEDHIGRRRLVTEVRQGAGWHDLI